MTKLWFSIFDREIYQGPEPYFFEPEHYPFSQTIMSQTDVIYQELKEYLKKKQLDSYFNSSMVSKENTWKSISIKTWNVNIYENYRHFPKTLKVIESIPGLVSASYTLLEPGGHIIPHCGDTNGIFRCHLGLEIPGQIPECGFRVGDVWKSWNEGKILIFTDAHHHEAVNFTDKQRIIFLFDIIRDEYAHQKNKICATVLTSLFLQRRAERFKILYKAPVWFQKLMATLLVPAAGIAIPVRNFLYKYRK